MRKFILLILNSSLFGCVANLGPKYSELGFVPPNGKVELIVFRRASSVGEWACYEVALDGRVIGKLANGGFLRQEIDPGLHSLSLAMYRGNTMDIEFQAEENQSAYMLFSLALNGDTEVPKEAIVSDVPDFKITNIPALHINNSLTQVTPNYAKMLVDDLGDSSQVSCSAVKFKN